MITGLLERAYTDKGTFGELAVGDTVLKSMERPWKGNEPGISCIPEGVYDVWRYDSPKFGECWILTGNGVEKYRTPDARWGILIHPANYPVQLAGCIAVGLKLNFNWGIADSKAALQRLFAELRGINHWQLDIRTKTIQYP